MNKPMKNLVSALTLSLMASTAMFGGQSGQNKVSPDALAADPSSMVNVIIQHKQGSASGSLTNNLVSKLYTATKHFSALNADSARVPASSLQQIAADTSIAYVSLDRKLGSRQAVSATAEYTTEPINAPAVWAQGFDGTGVGVAVIDSGISSVGDLQGPGKKATSRVVINQSFLLPATPLTNLGSLVSGMSAKGGTTAQLQSSAIDEYGHGTHVAGLIAGNGASSTGAGYFRTFSGVAPNETS